MKTKKEVTILYVMDALRADHLGCYGYEKSTSDCIDSLSRESILFKNIFSQSTETKSSAATIFTSTYPTVHNTNLHSDNLPSNLETLASCFSDAGFATAAFNTNFRIGAEFNFATGFDHYSDLYQQDGFDDVEVLPPSELVTAEIFDWLDSEEVQVAEKIFILAWAVDTHLPFTPPSKCISKFFAKDETVPNGTIDDVLNVQSTRDCQQLISLYDAEICHNDDQLKCLIDGLNTRNLWDNTTFMLTSDHGETFREHKHFFVHGSIPHKEITHVPLLLKGPKIPHAVNESFGGLIDIMPTLLTLNGISSPEFTQGRDLLRSSDCDMVFMESLLSYGHSSAVVTENWRFVRWSSPVNYLSKYLQRKKQFQPHSSNVKPLSLTDEEKFQQQSSFKRARNKRFIIDLKGNTPTLTWNLIAWGVALFKYYFYKERFELYCRSTDKNELNNVIAQHRNEIGQFISLLDHHLAGNLSLLKHIDLQQDKTAISDELTARLQGLGYLD